MENETTEQIVDEHAEALDHAGDAAHGETLGGEVLAVMPRSACRSSTSGCSPT